LKYLSTRFALLFLFLSAGSLASETTDVAVTLDTFHRAAASADLESYLEVTTEDVVFLGTDGSERWQGKAFRTFVEGHFSAGRGWVYTPVGRNIEIASDGATAWFDESLDNASLGRCRGSGVAVKTDGGWRIAQYNLSMPVPNAMVEQVVADIAALEATEGEGAGTAAGQSSVTQEESSPSLEQVGEEPPPAKCSRRRFKTNRKGGC